MPPEGNTIEVPVAKILSQRTTLICHALMEKLSIMTGTMSPTKRRIKAIAAENTADGYFDEMKVPVRMVPLQTTRQHCQNFGKSQKVKVFPNWMMADIFTEDARESFP